MSSRRDFLKVSLLATPMLLARCARTEPRGLRVTDGRFTARPRTKGTTQTGPARPSSKPRPLGLGDGRDGFLYVPATRKAAAPLLLYLHGAGGSGERVIHYLLGHADSTGTIVLAPDSRGMTWGCVSGDEDADVAFLDAALDKAFHEHEIDQDRIGIGGFSDGATAALSWGLVNGDLFSAIAAFSPGGLLLSSEPRGRPRVFISHGVDDEILDIDRCSRQIVPALREAGYAVDYREFEGGHDVTPEIGDAGLASLVGR